MQDTWAVLLSKTSKALESGWEEVTLSLPTLPPALIQPVFLPPGLYHRGLTSLTLLTLYHLHPLYMLSFQKMTSLNFFHPARTFRSKMNSSISK